MDFIGWLGFVCVAVIIFCGLVCYLLYALDKDCEKLFKIIVIVILFAYLLALYIAAMYGAGRLFDFLYYFFPNAG